MTPLAAVSWATFAGTIRVNETWLSWLGLAYAPYVLTVLALAEMVTDKLPQTPSRKAPIPFAGRVLSGAICGAAVGSSVDHTFFCALVGAIGAVGGTIGGAAARRRLAGKFGRDLPAALIEDIAAIVGAMLIFSML